MTKKIDLNVHKLHAGQKQVDDQLNRFNVLRCGRRWGKTTFAENRFLKPVLDGYPVAFGSPTYKMLADVWRVMKDIYAPITQVKNESEKRIELITGGVIDFWSLDSPDSVRGRKYKEFFVDEGAMIRDLRMIVNEIIMATLLDYSGGMTIASTPKGSNDFREIDKLSETNADWSSFHFTTYDNPLIPKEEIDRMVSVMSPRAVKQEIYAEYLDDSEFALFKYDDIQRNRLPQAPDDMDRIVVGIDPAVSSNADSDETGIIVAGKKGTEFYVFGDASGIFTPLGWAQAAINQYKLWKADRVIGERNNGGELIEANLRNVDRNISYKSVWASRGKAIRAEPVAALYEQNRVHHVGMLRELETEITTWTPIDKDSPNRLDALVWAITELMEDKKKNKKVSQSAYI